MSNSSCSSCPRLLSDDALDDIKLNVYGRTWQSMKQEDLGISDPKDILQKIRGNVDDFLDHVKALTTKNLKNVSISSSVCEIEITLRFNSTFR